MDKIASSEFKIAEKIESYGIKDFLADSTKYLNGAIKHQQTVFYQSGQFL